MLKNQNIICISSIDWDFIWQGHQEIMSTLAKNGNTVLFIENTGVRPPGIRDIPRIQQRIKNWFKGAKGIRQERENLYIYSPLVLPFPYSRIARWFNRHFIFAVLDKWMRLMNFYNPIIWTFLPTPLSLDIIDHISHKLLVYYCIDSFIVSSVSAKKIKQPETDLLKRADLTFVTSAELFNYCSEYSKNVYKFPFAVNFERFEKARKDSNIKIDELRKINRPIIGYIGGIHKWIDQQLIKEVAEKLSGYSFVFVGPIQTKTSLLSNLKNIYFLGKREHDELPIFINNFDVCIIPYEITDYTKNVYPTKLNEYHAMGKPVVSTHLPEVIEYNAANGNLVLIANTANEFIDAILKAIKSTDSGIVEKRITAAKNNSWANRIEQMTDLIERALDKKVRQLINWQESILKFYKAARKRVFKVVLSALIVYAIVFYTPFIWFLAKPLRISDVLSKSDAIVVFAGGVGESGNPGQGYQERVKYAVDLYNHGYAKHIIFSSGYTYIFHEPSVMKALALSLDVPQTAIILEDKAKNTYENVTFTKRILEKNNWEKIILVSSPYHMRRASLVFSKNAPNIRVLYAPISESLFYRHGIDQKGKITWRQINFQQLNGIIHEYLGIIYYWGKGLIL